MGLDPAEAAIVSGALLVILVPAAWAYVRFPGLKEELDASFFRRTLPLALLFAGAGLLLGVTPAENPRTRTEDLLLFLAIGGGSGFLAHARLGGVVTAAAFVAAFGIKVAWTDPGVTAASARHIGMMIGIHASILLVTATAGWLGGWASIGLDRLRTPLETPRGR